MTQIDLKKKDLSDSDFSGLDFKNKTFEGVDFHESVFNGAHFTKVHFINCNLQNTEFTEANITNCSFTNCNLSNSDFVYTTTSKIKFESCTFSHVEWRENNFENDSFQDCSFHNSTISLCTFKKTKFDGSSSSNLCGASKRYNVFLQTSFSLNDERLEFLKNNYGLTAESNSKFVDLFDHKTDPLLQLSGLKFCGQLTTIQFIDGISQAVLSIINTTSKGRIQKAKYLALICKSAVSDDDISVFGQQLLINTLNEYSKRIKDTTLFMELVDLIMFLKTSQYTTIISISTQHEEYKEIFSSKTLFKFHLTNTYEKNELKRYLAAMEDFIGIPSNSYKVLNYDKGSTILDIVFESGLKIASALTFIAFSLSKVNKSLGYMVEIKKNTKKLLGKTKTNTKGKAKGIAVVPLSVMTNEGNEYYVQINNTVNHFGTDAIRVDGSGKVNIIIDNSNSKKQL